jgi:membrane-bound lytic murein transglycosylase B
MLAGMGNSRQKARVNPASLARTLREKSEWAYAELKALIRHAEQLNRDPVGIPGSIYGAVGICQFMPSNIEIFGVDGDNDGGIDLFNLVDAMYSVASYLEGNGWRGASTDALKNQVILSYNKDSLYASTVLATSKRLASALKGTGKISPRSNAVVGGYSKNPYARLDPSLRRPRNVPSSARVNSLGDYQQVLQ